MNKPRILFVDDEKLILNSLKRIASKLDADIITAESGTLALEILANQSVDVIVSDIKMPKMDGIQLLEQVAKLSPETVRIVLTGSDDMSLVLSAINQGRVWGYLQKPWDNNDLIITLKQALELQQILAERTLMRRTIDQYQQYRKTKFEGFIGDSVPMQFVYSCIEQCSSSNASVFITGPSGSGKEVAAQAIHRLSKRNKNNFIALNCAAIPSELMESEVFGHIKGAFSGAVSNRDGAATLADGGSLFLDEIGEMDINLQAKLLRFIQTGQFQRVGSGKVEQVDIRFICATNRNPHTAIAEHKLREDLFYRLNVISIYLPPLCERGNDTIQLAEHFLSHYSKIEGKDFAGFSSLGKQLINGHPWPGNVRQLQNIIHSAVVMSEGPLISDTILKQQLTDNFQPSSSLSALPQKTSNYDIKAENSAKPNNISRTDTEILSLEKVERQAIEQAILVCQDNIVKAASELGVSPSTLYRKIQQWQTQPTE
ncbi:MAG: sigma-54 dependent transcriptional regulator [Colwellia sp.]|nr:sigma-54 dependent transcriptional regulator [Colwellia sp.]